MKQDKLTEESNRFEFKASQLIYSNKLKELIHHIGDKETQFNWLFEAVRRDKLDIVKYLYPLYQKMCRESDWITAEEIKQNNDKLMWICIETRGKEALEYLFQFLDINELNVLELAFEKKTELNEHIIPWLIEQGADITANHHEILKNQCLVNHSYDLNTQMKSLVFVYEQYKTIEQKKEAWNIIHDTITQHENSLAYANLLKKEFYNYHEKEILMLTLEALPISSHQAKAKL